VVMSLGQMSDLLEPGVCNVPPFQKYPEVRLDGGWGLLMYDTKHILGG